MDNSTKTRAHSNYHKKRSTRLWFTSVELFLIQYGLILAGAILVISGLLFILISKIGSGYFVNIGQWFLKGIPIKTADSITAEHLNYLLPSLMIWFVISISALGILKPSFSLRLTSGLWDSISYLSICLVIILTVLMEKVTGINGSYLIYTILTAAILISLAVLNERYHFIKGKRAFLYLVCISPAFILPLLLLNHYLLILASSLSVAFLTHSYICRSRKSLILSKIFFYLTALLFLSDWFKIFRALDDMISGGNRYPFHMLLSVIMVSAISFFYLRFKSFLLSKYPYLELKTILPSDIPERIFPFMVFSSSLLFFDFSLISFFPGYLPNFVEPAMFSYAFIWTYNYLNPAVSKPGRIFRIVFSYVAIILYPVVINPEINKYRYMLIEGEGSSVIPFLMHYACIILLMLLLVQSNKTLREIYHGENKTRHFRYLLVVIMITFILLTEFDHLTLLLLSNPAGIPATEMIILNKFLPYSIILILMAVSLLVYSKIRYSLFLRRISLGFIVLAVIKVFLLDLKILSESTSVTILISLGLALILIALVLQVIRKKRHRAVKRRKHTSSRHSNDQE